MTRRSTRVTTEQAARRIIGQVAKMYRVPEQVLRLCRKDLEQEIDLELVRLGLWGKELEEGVLNKVARAVGRALHRVLRTYGFVRKVGRPYYVQVEVSGLNDNGKFEEF